MSLPRRPSVGLPSTPRARSFTAGQVRQDFPPRPRSSASERPPPPSYAAAVPPLPTQARALRPQRSVGHLPAGPASGVRSRSLDRRADSRHASSRSDPVPPLPALPSLPSSPRLRPGPGQQRPAASAHGSTRSEDYSAYRKREDRISDSASSSSASDEMSSPASAASSRTSLDEGETEEKMDGKPPAGFGSSLWGRVTGVASNFSISVTKAWSSNIATYNGEDTPPGGESRLARAMKAYHADKARDPSELPAWLFDEHERGVRIYPIAVEEEKPAEGSHPFGLSRSVTTVRRDVDNDALPLPLPRIARGPTLADRKAALDTGPGSEAHVTKSMARLRELRDAKRTAKVRFGGTEHIDDEPSFSQSQPLAAAAPAPASQRAIVQEPAPPSKPRGMPAPLGASLGVRGRQPSTRMGLPSGVRPVRPARD